jgi:hypothetical protein
LPFIAPSRDSSTTVCGKFPYQPNVGKLLKPSDRIFIAIYGIEYDTGPKMARKSALPRNTELLGKLCPDMCNWLYFHIRSQIYKQFLQIAKRVAPTLPARL